jgi:hypothetical protein
MSKTFVQLFLIVILYVLFFGLIYVMAISSPPLLQSLNVLPAADPANQNGDAYGGFAKSALVVMVVSFISAIAWYCIAEWVFKVSTPVPQSRRLIWSLWLAVTVLGAFAAEFLGPKATFNAYIPTLFYFLGGVGFYYLATLLFSPVSYKYTPPGASAVRRW